MHHRRYAGFDGAQYWQYRCSGHREMGQSPCPRPCLNGRELEEKIKDICQQILTRPELIEAEITKSTGRTHETLQSIGRRLAALDTKEAKALDTETNLVMLRASGDASLEAYERALAKVRAQRAWAAEERQRLQAELEAARKRDGVVLGLREASEKLLTCPCFSCPLPLRPGQVRILGSGG